MADSSLSTYLDVSRAAQKAAPPTVASDVATSGSDVVLTAKVLAAVVGGAETLADLQARTELDASEILGALAMLSQAGLVKLEAENDILRARPTDAATAALS